jgi:hypothetical protein
MRTPTMRALLEFLGIVEPRETRNEPVALPAWARRVGPVLIVALTVCSMLVFVIVRALLS